MAKKFAGSKKNTGPKPRVSRSMIIAAALLVAAVGALLIFAAIRSNPGVTSNRTNEPAVSSERARQAYYEVINTYPHDPTSFTQGLLWQNGGFYESTGLYGQSKLRRLEFPSGRVLKETGLQTDLFGEGLTLVDGRLIQLTWKSHRGFVYDLDSFRLLQEFTYDTEGWGLTYDGKNLILSDGSSELFYLDPQSFKPVKRLSVTMNGRPVTELNELEFIEGEIWANVWQTDLILRIAPSTGQVTSFLDLKGVLAPSDKTGKEDVLNGIAYDSDKKRIFVTGKLWPRVFEIRIKS